VKTTRWLAFCLTLACFLLLLSACHKTQQQQASDRPRLTTKTTMRDVTFHSVSLNRDMQYRVILPASIAAGQKLPVVYLLHGGGGGFRDWSNYSDVSNWAEHGLILVMPEGGDSYYTNAVKRPEDRFEDYIVKDLISEVEAKFPVKIGRSSRAIVGVSMGGFGAIKLALKYPDLFVFAGGLSSALDVPSRPFSIKRISQWRGHRAIFGAWQGHTQHENDPYLLANSADVARATYMFLSCGEQEGLLPANRRFAALLAHRKFPYEFHSGLGNHDWNQWNGWLTILFQSLSEHINTRS